MCRAVTVWQPFFVWLLLTNERECCIFASSDVKNEGSSRNTRTQAVKSDRAQGYVH